MILVLCNLKFMRINKANIEKLGSNIGNFRTNEVAISKNEQIKVK